MRNAGARASNAAANQTVVATGNSVGRNALMPQYRQVNRQGWRVSRGRQSTTSVN